MDYFNFNYFVNELFSFDPGGKRSSVCSAANPRKTTEICAVDQNHKTGEFCKLTETENSCMKRLA